MNVPFMITFNGVATTLSFVNWGSLANVGLTIIPL
jgi:hypothetical protein